MTDSIKQRLIGAIVLLILFAAVAPVIFKPAKNPTVTIASQIPGVPELEVFSLPQQKQPESLEPVLILLENSRPKVTDLEAAENDAKFNQSKLELVDSPKPHQEVVENIENASLESTSSLSDVVEGETDVAQEIQNADLTKTEDSVVVAESEQPDISDVIDDIIEELPEEITVTSKEDKPLTLADAKSKPTAVSSGAETWALQLGAFGDSVNAERLASQLRAENFSVVVQRRTGPTRELTFVYVGPFFNIDNARSAMLDLEKADYKGKLVEFKL